MIGDPFARQSATDLRPSMARPTAPARFRGSRRAHVLIMPLIGRIALCVMVVLGLLVNAGEAAVAVATVQAAHANPAGRAFANHAAAPVASSSAVSVSVRATANLSHTPAAAYAATAAGTTSTPAILFNSRERIHRALSSAVAIDLLETRRTSLVVNPKAPWKSITPACQRIQNYYFQQCVYAAPMLRSNDPTESPIGER